MMDMQQFQVRYIPGGMTLNHSGWYVCCNVFHSGVSIDVPVKFISKSDYK